MRFTLYPIHWLADPHVDPEPFDYRILPFEVTENVHIEAVRERLRPGTFDHYRRSLGEDLVEVLESARYALVHCYNAETIFEDGQAIGEVQHGRRSEQLVRNLAACLRLIRPMR